MISSSLMGLFKLFWFPAGRSKWWPLLGDIWQPFCPSPCSLAGGWWLGVGFGVTYMLFFGGTGLKPGGAVTGHLG